MVKHHVEIRRLVATIASEEEVLRVSVQVEIALKVCMFTIELEIPSDDEESLDHIIDHKDLYEVINSSRKDVLNPNLRPKVDVEISGCFWTTKSA